MEFKERIKLLRREKGLTQRETAEKIGVTYRTYQNYESGASAPSGTTLAKLASLLDVSMDMLSPSAEKTEATAKNSELCALLDEMQALFMGGKVSDEDKKYVIDALTEGYWRSKELNKKYGRKNCDRAQT